MSSSRTDLARVEKPLTEGMRRLLVGAGVLVLLAGIQLFVFSERTDGYFAWTIGEPLTAAVLGAAYWSSAVIELMASRARLWAHARIAVPTVAVFTTLTLVVTLVHLEAFHLGAEHAPTTRIVTWAWIAIYAIVPVCLVALWILQARLGGVDPPRRRRLPAWVRAIALGQAVVLLPVGTWLLLAPAAAAPSWPWPLTDLTARAIGAWAIALGVAAAHSLVESDPARLRPAAVASILLAVLQLIALARYGDAVRWDSAAAAAFVAFLAAALAVGVGTLRAERAPASA